MQIDRHEDMLRSCLRAVNALSRVQGVETVSQFQVQEAQATGAWGWGIKCGGHVASVVVDWPSVQRVKTVRQFQARKALATGPR